MDHHRTPLGKTDVVGVQDIAGSRAAHCSPQQAHLAMLYPVSSQRDICSLDGVMGQRRYLRVRLMAWWICM